MIFDMRTYLGTSFDRITQTVSNLLKQMDSLKIEASMVIPFKPIDYQLEHANEWLFHQVQPYKDRLIPAARIDPWQPGALHNLEKAHQSLGMQVMYLDPWQEHFRADSSICDPLLNYAQTNQMTVMIHSGFPWRSEALQVMKLALRWPETSILMTNGGQINISGLGQADVTLALQKAHNLCIETAGVYRQDFLEESVQEFGAKRLVFGSGAPMFDQAFEVKRVEMLKVEDLERQAIQFGNALRLLKHT